MYPEISSEEQKEELLLKRVYELIGNLPDKRVEAGENISRTQEKQKKQYDQKVVETKFYIGNKVLLYKNSAKKLEEKWEGPFYIHDIGIKWDLPIKESRRESSKKICTCQPVKFIPREAHGGTNNCITQTNYQTPTYLTQTLPTQLLQLVKKMPGGEELIVTDEGVKIRKDGEEQILEETSPKPPTEIDEYLDEFRILRTDEKVLPKIDGDEDKQLTTILGKLKVTRHNNTFEYYYLLGKLIEEYPATKKKNSSKIPA
ncbi:6971_t:CDS:2 [Entrophospora sp. SA101]|nr:6971_t:CDS:2 [Entrophospora sp. SA101]